MAKQYVGARYVPVVYKNPDDGSASWKANVDYEPLTIVVASNGDSYTSKKAVPKSVGAPQDNPVYWVKTGEFNASLLALQNRVNTLENTTVPAIEDDVNLLTNRVNTLENTTVPAIEDDVNLLSNMNYLHGKKVVAYGDSTITNNTGGTGESYLTRAMRLAGADFTNRGVAGSEMATNPNNGKDLINAATDLSTFDYMFLCYSTNDWQMQYTAEAVQSHAQALINAAITQASEVRIIFVFPFYSYRDFNNNFDIGTNGKGLKLLDVINIVKRVLNAHHIPYIDLYAKSTCNYHNYDSLLQNSSGIYVHSLPKFRQELANIILDGPDQEENNILTPILDNMDFVQARKDLAAADFTSFNDMFLKFASTAFSRKKFFTGGEIVLKGIASSDNGITVTIGTLTFVIPNGTFQVTCKPSFSFNQILLSGSNCELKNFMVYRKAQYPETNGWYNNFGCSYKVNPATDVTNDLIISDIKDGIEIEFGTFKIAAGTHASGKLIYQLPSDLYFVNDVFHLETNGNWYTFIVTDNRIRLGGNYNFPSELTFTLPRIRLLNPAYPSAKF